MKISQNNVQQDLVTIPISCLGFIAFNDEYIVYKSKNRLFKYLAEHHLVIPNKFRNKLVTTILTGTFMCSNLASVDLPNSLSTIKKSAFYNNNLTHVKIPATIQTIESNAFRNNNIKIVKIPNTITYLANDAFDKEVKIIKY